jgi:hypothetical protein
MIFYNIIIEDDSVNIGEEFIYDCGEYGGEPKSKTNFEDDGFYAFDVEFTKSSNFLRYVDVLTFRGGKTGIKIRTNITIDYRENLPILSVVGIQSDDLEIINCKHANKLLTIIEKYEHRNDRKKAILECQNELINSGFASNAYW